MSITVRAATAGDQAAITALIRSVRINPLDVKWPNFLVAVEEATGAVVATGQIKRHQDGSEELASIGTLPAYRRQGLAHEIIRRLVAQHPQRLYLTCLGRMGGLYETFGFRRLEPREYPPYFRRLARLARIAELGAAAGERLWVMAREGGV
ncbi:MAG: GNAT family N-acetyltransferase [Anaerolineales bacterium]|nr:GNAT family N-acetyltransferase [Anaerolineales bacterium]